MAGDVNLPGAPGQEGAGGGAPAQPEATRLEELRQQIAALDEQLIRILGQRLALAAEIGEVKRRLGLPVLDPAREAEVVRRAAAAARDQGVDPELVRDVLWRLIAQSRGIQDHAPPLTRSS